METSTFSGSKLINFQHFFYFWCKLIPTFELKQKYLNNRYFFIQKEDGTQK